MFQPLRKTREKEKILPPIHTTFAARGILPPNFSALKPRNYRIPYSQSVTHVAWSCDGTKLAAVGIDQLTRVWNPDQNILLTTATAFSGGHCDSVDYVSWNPTHPDLFCTSSQRDRSCVFWDARQSQYTHHVSLIHSPVQISYAPDGQSLFYISAGHQLFFLNFEKTGEDATEKWHMSNREVHLASTAIFSHAGDSAVMAHRSEHTLRVVALPSMNVFESPVAHIGGCIALALDPRGIYMASGGHDTIVNLFDTSDWIIARTITACDDGITALSFSYDGEYLAIANTGEYIDICATETGIPLHRVTTLASSPTVSWHPSKYVIAYCGQTGVQVLDGGRPSGAVISMFGLFNS